ncbi:hypothetical protein FRC01_005390 [Tulasnella sp. 417]|nr:hypothetical protein FRC01_005390 [Tulasnella sp. 417]
MPGQRQRTIIKLRDEEAPQYEPFDPFRLLPLEIIFAIFDLLTMLDLVVLYSTSQALKLLTQRYLDGDFDILLA